ncbi:MAG: hypothetical protein ACYCWE_06275 [Eubacteriales bacterium]
MKHKFITSHARFIQRIIPVFIIFSLLTGGIFCSCTDSAEQPAVITNPVVSQEEAETTPYYMTLEADYGGASFRVMGIVRDGYDQFTNFEIDSEGENGEVVNDAIYRRNSIVEEKYNVNITCNLCDQDQIVSSIGNLAMSGDDAYELYFIQLRFAGSTVTKGYNLDMYTLPYIDYSQPYWNSEVNTALSVGGKLYFTTSDYSLVDKNRTYILVYNRDMAKQYGHTSLEDFIWVGSWTYDKMISLAADVSVDLDGNSKMNENDQWGLMLDSNKGVAALNIAMGGHLVMKDENDKPVINVGSEFMYELADKLYRTLNGNDYALEPYITRFASMKTSNMFTDGHVLFYTCFPHVLKTCSAVSDIDYGVLSFPKYDEAQEKYHTLADPYGSGVFCVPYISGQTEMTGLMLEVLSAGSTETTLKAFYELSCKTKYTYDETSAAMLDLVFSDIVYDLGVMFDWGGISTNFVMQVMTWNSNKYVSEWASVSEKAQSALEDTLTYIEGLEN